MDTAERRLKIIRKGYTAGHVLLDYRTRQLSSTTEMAGIEVHPAIGGFDYPEQSGFVEFLPGMVSL